MRPSIALLSLSAVTLVGCSTTNDSPSLSQVYPWEGEEWPTDIVIDGPVEDQQAVRSFIYYLRQNVGEGRLGPFGDTNERYEGRVFWDADVWVFPALALVDPEKAKAIPDFRVATAQHAQLLTSRSLGYTDTAELLTQSGSDYVIPSAPLKFAWETDREGLDAGETDTSKQEHGSGAVAFGLRMASDLGLDRFGRTRDIGKAVATYYIERSETGTDGTRHISDVVSVDEWTTGDDCLYTNVIAEWTVRTFLDNSARFYRPRDQKGEFIAYDGDRVKAYQQAAAPLILWPLEREELVDDPIAFLDRFEGKEAPAGPAMSLSVYALIRARYGDADRALDVWRTSWKKYTDGNEHLLFSEKPGRTDLIYFNTGAAGCLNAVIYGFIGARIVDDASNDSAKIALENGRWLVFRPNLPREWRRVTFKGLQVLGKRYTVVCKGRTALLTAE